MKLEPDLKGQIRRLSMAACICNSISQVARAARLCVQGQPGAPHTHTKRDFVICQLVNTIVGKGRSRANRSRMCVTRKDDD